nr:hypothetical protein, expressed [Toxoplasma gondii RH]
MSQVSKSLASHISASINRTGKMDPVTRRFNPCLAFCVVNILLLCIGNLTYDPQSYIILREAFFQGQEHRRHCALNLLSISNAYAARVPPNSGDTARPLTSSNAGRRSSSPTPPASTASNRHPPLHQPSTERRLCHDGFQEGRNRQHRRAEAPASLPVFQDVTIPTGVRPPRFHCLWASRKQAALLVQRVRQGRRLLYTSAIDRQGYKLARMKVPCARKFLDDCRNTGEGCYNKFHCINIYYNTTVTHTILRTLL